ncbi:MAG: hypothetical protein QGH60_10440 [Phycisphaerae bacterium]|jgi:hypothetical protein|nr:hypothetical protein [Phycisphaerae bacterium]
MRALQWHKYLEQAERRDHKTVFTVTELANIAGVGPHSLNVQLGRLVARGVIVRYASGKYGLPGRVRSEELVGFLDSGAYITSLRALYHHNLVTQRPTRITCFTNRRHNRSRIRKTPIGTFSFVCVSGRTYHRPVDGNIAPGEQAFYDWLYLCSRKGVAPESLVTFSNLSGLREEVLADLRPRYPKTVAREAGRILTMGNGRGEALRPAIPGY